jgi:hypothetical protein
MKQRRQKKKTRARDSAVREFVVDGLDWMWIDHDKL